MSRVRSYDTQTATFGAVVEVVACCSVSIVTLLNKSSMSFVLFFIAAIMGVCPVESNLCTAP